MNRLTVIASLFIFIACSSNNELALIDKANFTTTVDGSKVSLYTINGGDITMQVTNYGARVVSLWVPDRDGKQEDVVLGYNNIDGYLYNKGERFLGAAVGRYANRIACGEFELDGKTYTLPKNNNGQTLHGGLKGVDNVVWGVDKIDNSSVCFSCLLPDGQDGFPGNLHIKMTYSLTPANEFVVTYAAKTDAPTIVNLSHHSFFNLKGEGRGTILDHVLTINASNTTPVDSVLIPTGEIVPVDGTPFDFREPRMVGERIDSNNEQLKNGAGYDHNWIVDGADGVSLIEVAELYEPTSGRCLEVWSDQPGLQFYSGNFFDGSTEGKYGRPLAYRESVALETQKFPDSPNHPDFPSTILTPDEVYTHTCIYKFSTK